MKIYGYIPVRMAASRFPGKPLKKIRGLTMLEHVFERSKIYQIAHHKINCENFDKNEITKKIIKIYEKK